MHNVVPRDILQGAITSVEGLVDDIANRLLLGGKIQDPCKDGDFATRLIELERQFQHANVLLHKNGVLPPGIQDVWSHKSMMAIAEQILGSDSDIMGHPVWNLRCKTPETLSKGQATVPWHQDTAYLDEECWDKLQLTAWVPLVDATTSNGCMQVVRKGHLSGITANHACCVGGTWYVEVTPEELEATLGCDMKQDVVTCEVPCGSVLFLNNIVPHRSLPNYSKDVRWSLDLRWQRGGEPNGFSGIKESVLMKPAGLEKWDGQVDWGEWAAQDRVAAGAAALSKEHTEIVEKVGEEEGRYNESKEFDTTIAGPWMTRWGLLNHNRHTDTIDLAQ